MPVTWRLERTVLIVTLVGECVEGAAKAIREAIASPKFRSGTPLVMDVRRCRDNPKSDEFRNGAQWIAALRDQGLSARCAIVVSARPHHYGLARMGGAYLSLYGMDLEIFSALDEALRWLRSSNTAAGAGGAH